jgi:hypothetical protein
MLVRFLICWVGAEIIKVLTGSTVLGYLFFLISFAFVVGLMRIYIGKFSAAEVLDKLSFHVWKTPEKIKEEIEENKRSKIQLNLVQIVLDAAMDHNLIEKRLAVEGVEYKLTLKGIEARSNHSGSSFDDYNDKRPGI